MPKRTPNLTDEWKKNIGKANAILMKKKWQDPEYRIQQVASHKGKPSPMKGKKTGKSSWNKGNKGFRAGEKHHWWKGGVTATSDLIRTSTEYKLWRKSVFERDDYICRFCEQRGGNIQADHIKPFSLFPELRFAIDNGRTLCEDCHRKTPTYGKGVLKYKPPYCL